MIAVERQECKDFLSLHSEGMTIWLSRGSKAVWSACALDGGSAAVALDTPLENDRVVDEPVHGGERHGYSVSSSYPRVIGVDDWAWRRVAGAQGAIVRSAPGRRRGSWG